MKEVETFIGPCSKYINKQGWTTEIPVTMLNDKGYYKLSDEQIKLINNLYNTNYKVHQS